MNNFSLTQSGIKIGATIDTKPLYFVPVIDHDGQIVQVPYRSSEITIQQLIENYKDISCHNKETFFVILQGYYSGNTAKNQFELSSMDLCFDKPCFKAVDKVDEESIKVTESKLIASEQHSMIRLKVRYIQDTFQVKISSNENVISLKSKLKEMLDFEYTETIQINFQNIILLDKNKLSHYKGLTNGSQIAVVLRCKTQSCFKKGTMVTTANNDSVAIESLKKGMKVLYFDQSKESFEQDDVHEVKKQNVSEEIKIVLQDETIIEATPNQLFLCSDKRYRRFQFQPNSQPLKVGDILVKSNKETSAVKSLEFKQLNPPQQFYCFFLKKGQNAIANKTITSIAKAHNRKILIEYQKIHSEELTIGSEQSIKSLKKTLEKRFQEHYSGCMKVVYNIRECVDSAKVYDYGNAKGTELKVNIKQESDYNFLHPETEIIFEGNVRKKIKDILEQEDRRRIQIQNERSFLLADQPQKKKIIQQYYKIFFEEGEQVYVSGDTFLEMENEEIKLSNEVFELFAKGNNGFYLKKSNGEKIKVVKIQKASFKIPGEYFYRLPIPDLNPVIISPSITIYNYVIYFSFESNIIIAFGVNKKTTILDIKKKMSAMYKQPVRALHFFFNSQQLINQTTFEEKHVGIGQLIIVKTSQITKSMLYQPAKTRKIQLKISESQIYKIDYDKFRSKTVQQIMKYLIPSYKSSFFFLYEKLIILPTEKLLKIQEDYEIEDEDEEFTVTVIRNQKLSFVMNMYLKGSAIQNFSFILNERQSEISMIDLNENDRVKKVQSASQYIQAQKRIKKNPRLSEQFKQQEFYRPFLYFFNPNFREQMREFMMNFSLHLEEQTGGNVFKAIKSLYINMFRLQNHITKPLGETFFGVRNFKFNSHFKKNDTFYLYEYLMTSNDEEAFRSEIINQRGTLFRLTSTTGKQINHFSVNPPRKISQTVNGRLQQVDYLELLFPPYTYFLVDKIERHGDEFDEVWISEISTPWVLQKDIILWVDDIPSNNVVQMKRIKQNGRQLEILPLTSTLQARKWLKEFGWLMTWKGINFKFVTDMHRNEYTEEDNEIQSRGFAGFELLDKIYEENEGNIKACVYTGDKQRVQDLLNDPKYEKIRVKYAEKAFRIQDQADMILEFCNDG